MLIREKLLVDQASTYDDSPSKKTMVVKTTIGEEILCIWDNKANLVQYINDANTTDNNKKCPPEDNSVDEGRH